MLPSTVKMVIIQIELLFCDAVCGTDVHELPLDWLTVYECLDSISENVPEPNSQNKSFFFIHSFIVLVNLFIFTNCSLFYMI